MESASEGQVKSEEQQPTPQSDPVADVLKKEGLYDPERAFDAVSAVKELGASKRKIASMQAEQRKLHTRMDGMEEALRAKAENAQIEETYADPGEQALARKVAALERTVTTVTKNSWLAAHSDYLELQDDMREVLKEKPYLKRLSGAEQMDAAYDIVKARKTGDGTDLEKARADGAKRALAGDRATMEGSGTPVNTHTVGPTREELLAEMNKKLYEARGQELNVRRAITDKYEARIKALDT